MLKSIYEVNFNTDFKLDFNIDFKIDFAVVVGAYFFMAPKWRLIARMVPVSF